MLAGATLDAIDLEVIRDLGPEDGAEATPDPADALADLLREGPGAPTPAERELEAKLLAQRGDAPGLGVLLEQAAEEIDAGWAAVAEAVRDLCAVEASADLAAIAVLLAAGDGAWPAVLARAAEVRAEDRLGRLAHAAVALRPWPGSESEALGFLRAEAARFLASLHQPRTDTAALAAVALMRRHDPPTLAALEEVLRANAPDPVAGRAMIGLMGTDPPFAGALEAIVARGFGRASEGEPVTYAAAFARAAPERARDVLARLSAAEVPPERRAALVVGALVAEPHRADLMTDALGLLERLDPAKEDEAAAALALLRAADEADIAGFAGAAARWRSLQRSPRVGAALTRWFEQVGAEIG